MEKSISKIIAKDIAECAVFVALMVASAYIKIPFPLMPLTFQTAVGVLSGLILGWKKGVISMAVYCFMGLIGLPVFTDGGGIFYVLKPSFGYIIGFIASAAVAGLAVRKRSTLARCICGALAAVAVDYAIGIPYCLIAAKLLNVGNLWGLFISGNLVFLPKDAALCIIGAFVAHTVNGVKRNKY